MDYRYYMYYYSCWRGWRGNMAGGCVLDGVGALPRMVLLALLVGTQVAGAPVCPAAEIEDCLRPLDPLTTRHRTILPSYDTTTLTKVCRSFRQMEQCLSPLRAACGVSQSRVYSGVQRARDFLCGHGLKEYGDHKVCMAKDALAAEGRVCNMTSSDQEQGDSSSSRHKRGQTYTALCQLEEQFKAVGSYRGCCLWTADLPRAYRQIETDPLADLARVYQSPYIAFVVKNILSPYYDNFRDADRFMTCVREAVLRHCGGGAALWVENVNSKVFSPLLDSSGCGYHKHSNMGIAIIFGLTIVVFVLMLVIISILLARRRKRHKNNYTRASLSMLAMSLDDQSNMASKHETESTPCSCKTYICNPECGKTQTLSKMAAYQNHHQRTPLNQDGRHTSDVISGTNHSATYELGRVVVGREEELGEKEEEIDQSSPRCISGRSGRKRLGGFLHGRKEYYLLTAGDQDWRLEEEDEEGEEEGDRDFASHSLLNGENSIVEESDGGGGTRG